MCMQGKCYASLQEYKPVPVRDACVIWSVRCVCMRVRQHVWVLCFGVLRGRWMLCWVQAFISSCARALGLLLAIEVVASSKHCRLAVVVYSRKQKWNAVSRNADRSCESATRLGHSMGIIRVAFWMVRVISCVHTLYCTRSPYFVSGGLFLPRNIARKLQWLCLDWRVFAYAAYISFCTEQWLLKVEIWWFRHCGLVYMSACFGRTWHLIS